MSFIFLRFFSRVVKRRMKSGCAGFPFELGPCRATGEGREGESRSSKELMSRLDGDTQRPNLNDKIRGLSQQPKCAWSVPISVGARVEY